MTLIVASSWAIGISDQAVFGQFLIRYNKGGDSLGLRNCKDFVHDAIRPGGNKRGPTIEYCQEKPKTQKPIIAETRKWSEEI